MSIRRFIFKRMPNASAGMLLTLVAGLSVPLPAPTTLSVVTAAVVASSLISEPASAATAAVSGAVELSPTPPNETQSVPPNIVVTFDDSGSMVWTHMGDNPPYTLTNAGATISGLSNVDWSNGPWRCAAMMDADSLDGASSTLDALAMNGVYYNPNVIYSPPVYANGTNFPNAGDSANSTTSLNYLDKVWADGVSVNRPLSPVTAATTAGYNNNPDMVSGGTGTQSNLAGTATITYPTTKTYYVSFGACASNADAGSCTSNSATKITSGTNKNDYYYSYKNGTLVSGSGVTAVYDGTSMTTGTSTSSGWTQVVGTTTSTKYNTWTVSVTNTSGTPTITNDNRWECGTASTSDDGWSSTSPMDGQSHVLSDGKTYTYPNGGPFYYRMKKGTVINLNTAGTPSTTTDVQNIYTSSNWEAVPVPASQYQNFANWYAYYRARNLMARSSLSRVFGSSSLAATTSTGGYGSTIRVAWQNLNTTTYKLPTSTLISSLIDTTPTTCASTEPTLGSAAQQTGTVTAAPACYRSDFFNWIFQVPAANSTPTRSAIVRAGKFFQRGYNSTTNVGNTGATGDLHDPYWQPPSTGTFNASTNPGNELACRQNFHMLVTDGLWNQDSGLPTTASLSPAVPTASQTLPDGNTFLTSGAPIYAAVHDVEGSTTAVSLSDVAYYYWATDLRPDLYAPSSNKYVTPYLPDTTTGVVTATPGTSSTNLSQTNGISNEIYFNPANDPASWPHMSEYLIGLGVNGQLNQSTDTDCKISSSSDACALRKGNKTSLGSVGWPTPDGAGNGLASNIDDTWHAALDGRGQFFSARSPSQLVSQLTSVLTSISARAANPTIGAINASVLTTGALAFDIGYSSANWTGTLQAYVLNSDGTTGSEMWDAGSNLTSATTTPPANRAILTGSLNSSGSVTGMAFESSSTFDTAESTGLMTPASTDSTNDTQTTRINYLRGVRTEEANSVMRTRNSLLGAIINSQAVYVSYPSSGYTDNWPSGSPEATAQTASNGTDDKSYDSFVSDHSSREPTLYVGANDGMLHAFYAPIPTCTATSSTTGLCTNYSAGTNAGNETFAYVPRAAYSGLGNLTSASSFSFAPTVDGTPVVRDVFFSESSHAEWHSLLTGGLQLGGRGVYALDITDPTKVTEANAASKVLWELDSDSTVSSSCVVVGNSTEGTTCSATDLGFTYGQPNVGRLANGKWVVIVPSGYFPDCSQTDKPVICNSTGYPTQPKDSAGVVYSSLFVLDAQTGAMIAELKTPSNLTGVSSYGLGSPVLGDYNNDQIDDVAFAGDLAGNLWRFDLSDPSPANWKVTLAYQPATQGAQSITVMPRLFPDPATNRFIVVFGTGKYLGTSDASNTATQAIYGIRDELDSSGNPVTITLAGSSGVSGNEGLVQQTLTEVAAGSTTANAGATLREVTSNAVPATDGGWYINLNVESGERVVVTPSAIFASNTVIIQTLIPGSSDPCNPSVDGAVMAFDATTGGAGVGVESLGGSPYIGALVNNVRTSGTLPVATQAGGGALILPGMTLTGKKSNAGAPLSLDAPIWRRRSWLELNNDQ